MMVLLILSTSYKADGSQTNDTLPWVHEHVDTLVELHIVEDGYSYRKLVFVRNGKVLATRSKYSTNMVFTSDEDGKLCVIWRDYWTAWRKVTFDDYYVIDVPYDISNPGERGKWWNQFRNMNDLKPPPEA